eukprot:scaffold7727_cov73-Skeletonema_menzelii.AAC.4
MMQNEEEIFVSPHLRGVQFLFGDNTHANMGTGGTEREGGQFKEEEQVAANEGTILMSHHPL